MSVPGNRTLGNGAGREMEPCQLLHHVEDVWFQFLVLVHTGVKLTVVCLLVSVAISFSFLHFPMRLSHLVILSYYCHFLNIFVTFLNVASHSEQLTFLRSHYVENLCKGARAEIFYSDYIKLQKIIIQVVLELDLEKCKVLKSAKMGLRKRKYSEI